MQEATVKKASVIHEQWKGNQLLDQYFEHKIVYICDDLSEAYECVENHKDMLNSDERYDIYYRYEEIEPREK